MTDTIPLFPLGTVLLPGSLLPLHIFEARYRQLVMDLVNEVVPQRRFGVVGIKQGAEVGDDGIDTSRPGESLYEVGCSAVLNDVHQLPEGRYDIAAAGEQPFRLLQVDTQAAPYLMARVEWLYDTASVEEISGPSADRLAASARAAHRRYHSIGVPGAILEPAERDGSYLDRLSFDLAEDCVLSAEDRQALLAETDPLARLRTVRTSILREAEFLRELRAVPAPLSEFAQHASVN